MREATLSTVPERSLGPGELLVHGLVGAREDAHLGAEPVHVVCAELVDGVQDLVDESVRVPESGRDDFCFELIECVFLVCFLFWLVLAVRGSVFVLIVGNC